MSLEKLCEKLFTKADCNKAVPLFIDIMKKDFDKALEYFADLPTKNVIEESIVKTLKENKSNFKNTDLFESQSFLTKIKDKNKSLFESGVTKSFASRFMKLMEMENDYTIIAKSISDEESAKVIADKQNGVVIQDEDDKDKFAVIIKEAVDTTYPYTTEVDVDITKGTDSFTTDTATIKYNFYIDARSWGIKSLECETSGTVSVEWVNDDTNESGVLEVDLSTANIIWESGTAYVPNLLTINLGEDNTVEELNLYVYFENKI